MTGSGDKVHRLCKGTTVFLPVVQLMLSMVTGKRIFVDIRDLDDWIEKNKIRFGF